MVWRRIATAVGVIGATVALHEAAHALAAVRAGGRVKELGLGFGPPLARTRVGRIPVALRALPLGGYAAIDVEELPPPRRIPMLLAGPLANIAVGLPLMLGLRAHAPLFVGQTRPVGLAGTVGTVASLIRAAGQGPRAVAQLAGAINVGLGLMNLLPVYPLDGGHVAMAAMEQAGVPSRSRQLFARLTAAIFLTLVQLALLADLRRLLSSHPSSPA